MALRAVFFDLDGTLVTAGGSMVPGAAAMLQEIKALGLQVVIGSNHTDAYVQQRLRVAGLAPDQIVSRESVGVSKPSPQFCYQAAEGLGVKKNQLVYVGDDNRTDALCAINAGVLYLNAMWANNKPDYGIKVSQPEDVVRFVRAFLMRDPTWYWHLNTRDTVGPLDVRAIIPGGRDWDATMGQSTFSVLKLDTDIDFPVIGKFSRFLFLYLLATIYLDELHDEFDTWCIIPPSGGQGHRKLFADFLAVAPKLFKQRFLGDLLIRHRPAQKAAFARHGGEDPGFLNQANTLRLNAEHQKAVAGKRIVVLDDFCTRGHSFECARHLLERGGAAKVTCLSVGRYGTRYTAQAPRLGLSWNPWQPAAFRDGDFHPAVHQRFSDGDALPPIREAFSYIISS